MNKNAHMIRLGTCIQFSDSIKVAPEVSKGPRALHACLAAQAAAKISSHGYESQDVYMHTAPLFHIGGIVSWLAMLQVGATHVMMPKYRADELLRLVSEHSATAMIAVPAVLVDIIETAKARFLKCQERKRT